MISDFIELGRIFGWPFQRKPMGAFGEHSALA
jgi:hypothetical protein